MTHENRFGLFIHWGIYALTGLQEQAFARYDLPREEYEGLQAKFNPVHYDPEQWVLMAKAAGMTYICFTAKHHDGFCMWDTKYTDYSVMHTPYGRDVLKMLADACQKHGMKLGIYYSNPDWHHPKGFNPHSTHQWKAVNQDAPDFEPYQRYIRDQITELLTNYGPIYTMFWDIPPRISDPSLNAYVRQLQPGIFINDRGFDAGDFSTPERQFDRADHARRYTRMTEACNSIDVQSWGYRRDSDFYSCRHLISAIDKTMAMGGSYLLNIGPRADGTIDPAHAARIRRIGDWVTRMQGCLECHEADPFDYGVRMTDEWIATKKDGKTYLHFYNGLPATAVYLTDYPGMPKRARLLNTGAELPCTIGILPAYIDAATGRAERRYLSIRGIPADELADEAVVIELEWQDSQ
ncbi:MAG: alpha-L-fucosidase [Clostridiaceae bacterium]|nr:alpha-L-fucosidase [Clostridiaceae bacterium]